MHHRIGGLLLDQGPTAEHKVCNIAGEGFALCAMTAAVANGYIERAPAVQVIDSMLKALEQNPQLRFKGWISHLIDLQNPEHLTSYTTRHNGRVDVSEYSTIDTTLFMMGALIARQFFGNEMRIASRVTNLFNDMDFHSLLAPPAEKRGLLLSHGFKATGEQIPWYWDTCSEGILVSFLSQGQGTPALPGKVWYEWDRRLFDLPLFTSYYPHCFLDFTNRLDESGLDLRERTRMRMMAHIDECAENGIEHGLFGVTACYAMISKNGQPPVREYLVAHGIGEQSQNRVIAPHAVIASLPFVPAKARSALEQLVKSEHLDYGHGPVNSVNLTNGLVDTGVTTIDVGSALLSLPEMQQAVYSISNQVPEFRQAWKRCRIHHRQNL